MRILVIGGTGFVGLWVVRQLHEAGHRVVVFHRGKTTADLPAGVDQLHGDRAQIAEFAVDFRRLAPDVALDMVPMTERDARSVVDSFRGVASRLVAISSADVYRAWQTSPRPTLHIFALGSGREFGVVSGCFPCQRAHAAAMEARFSAMGDGKHV